MACPASAAGGGVAALHRAGNSRLTKFDRILGSAVVRFLVGQGWSRCRGKAGQWTGSPCPAEQPCRLRGVGMC